MGEEENFTKLINGIQSKFTFNDKNSYEFFEFYEKSLTFMKLLYIVPQNDFTLKRINLIGRNLALSIYFCYQSFYEEAQMLLRQILDLSYMIIYGSNHILEIEEIYCLNHYGVNSL